MVTHLFRNVSFCLVLAGPAAGEVCAQKNQDRLEASVDKALAFLQKMQEPDGSWSSHGGISALSVLAFLSAGHVPGEGPYAKTLDKGIRYVLKADKPDMYHIGISALMLSEVAGMTDGKLGIEIRRELEKSVRLILRSQKTQLPFKGGWRYQLDSPDADVSVTGWQIMALRSAKNLGCDVPAERIDWAVDFILRCRHTPSDDKDPTKGAFAYQPGSFTTIPCTGTAILILELCKGGHPDRETMQAACWAGGSYLIRHPLQIQDSHFCYGLYYCSQAMFQLGKNYWAIFRPHLHKLLLDRQKANGAWLLDDSLGPCYATAMGVLALTVEYRYLPIYQRHEEPEGKK